MNNSTQTRMRMRAGFYVGVLVTLGIIMLGWWLTNGPQLHSYADRLVAIGRLLGLLAAWSVIIQIILMSRVPFIEQNFDLEDNIQLHRYNGYTMLATITGHVVFLVLGYALPLHTGLINQFVIFNTSYSDVFIATIGTIVFFGASALSLQVIRSKMNYELWFLSHITVYLAILLTFFHQISTGGDFKNNYWFTVFWYALYILAFVVWLRYRISQPLLLALKHDFKVSAIEMTAKNTYSVILTGKHVSHFSFAPGQYATWRVLSGPLWYQAHPFSISSTAGSETLRFSVKASPEFTDKVAHIPIGTRVIVDGPRGSFTAERANDSQTNDVLLVAGGIGVTPYLSMIDALLDANKKVTLLYSARTQADIAFKQELEALQIRGVIINTYLSDRNQTITPEILKSFVQPDSVIYICGPDAMSRLFETTLQEMGVKKKYIITERFAF